MRAEPIRGDQEAGGRVVVRSIRAAFSSWWSALGIVAASVTGFNLARRLIPEFQLAEVVAEVVRYYQSVVHDPIIWLCGWLHWPSPPTLVIDAAVLWLLVGGVVLRSAFRLRRHACEASVSIAPPEARAAVKKEWRLRQLPMQILMEWRGSSMLWRVSLVLFALTYILLWPWVLIAMLMEPRVYHLRDWRYQLDFVIPSARRRRNKECDRGSLISESTFLYDLRIVLSTQALVATLCIAIWFALNAVLKLYA